MRAAAAAASKLRGIEGGPIAFYTQIELFCVLLRAVISKTAFKIIQCSVKRDLVGAVFSCNS